MAGDGDIESSIPGPEGYHLPAHPELVEGRGYPTHPLILNLLKDGGTTRPLILNLLKDGATTRPLILNLLKDGAFPGRRDYHPPAHPELVEG